MKVLYGVCGEGLGHATRSSVVILHLMARGHDIRLVSSGHALTYLQRQFPSLSIFPTTGLTISKAQGRLDDIGTVASNLWKQAVGSIQSAASFLEAAAVWRPDIVISDFDAFSARVAHACQAPLIAIDNIHAYSKCVHPAEVTEAVPPHALGAGLFVADAMVPFARRYLVASCFPGIPKHSDTAVFAPILRDKIFGQRGAPRDRHVTVYMPQAPIPSHDLAALPCDSHVWISGLDAPYETARVSYRRFDEDAFIHDLASARAVISTAGHSLLSEAAYLGVPMLVVPLRGQFEQELNAAYVEYLGWGETHTDGPLSWERIAFFLERCPAYAETLSRLPEHDKNRALLHALDIELAAIS